MITKSFGLLFYLKKRAGASSTQTPIYLRITVNGEAKEISMQRSWFAGSWNSDTGRALIRKGRLPAASQDGKDPQKMADDARSLNAYLDTVQAKVFEAKHHLIESTAPVTAESIKNIVLGLGAKGERPHMLLEIFQYHNDQVKALVGREYARGTLTKFTTVLNHTREFLRWKFKEEDIDIRSLNYEFATELEFWYKSIQKCDHNTTMKYIACIKKMAIRAINNGWLRDDPFRGFNMALREVDKEPLMDEELQRISDKSFPTARLTLVRDIFLFSCYTGLAYADIQKLKRSEISIGVDGEKWIFTKRQKTETSSRIPILPMALQILNKYADHAACSDQDKALPILSNQKMNAYLKEIADCCGITKTLTFHIARHTFATTVTLSNGVPIETVSKILGHRSLKTTQHYAKIVDRKVSHDMKALKEKLSRST